MTENTVVFNVQNVVEILNGIDSNRNFSWGHAILRGFFVYETTDVNNASEFMEKEEKLIRVYLETDMTTTIAKCIVTFKL